MNNENRDEQALLDEIMAQIDSIQKDHLVKESKRMLEKKDAPSIVDEAIFDEIKGAQSEIKVPRSKSPIRRMLEEDEEENTAEEEQAPASAAIIYDDVVEDIEDFEQEDEKDEIYRDLKNTVGKMAVKSIAIFLISILAIYLFVAAYKPALFGNAIDEPWYQVVFLVLDCVSFALFSSIFLQGLALLLKGRADTDTFLALLNISLIAVRVINLIKLDFLPHPLNLEPMLMIGLLININSKKKIAANIKRNFKFIASSGDKLTITKTASSEANNALILETEEGGDVAYTHRTGLVSGFINNSYCDFDWDRGIQHFLFATLIFIIVGFIALAQLAGWEEAALFPAAAIATSLPFFARHFYAASIFKVGKKARKRGGVLTSADSAKELEDVDLMVLSDTELLGNEAVLLQGVKAIGDLKLDTLLTFIAALFNETNSPFKPLFLKMIDSKSVKLPKVDDVFYHPGEGYTCLIESKMFYVGTAEFMRNFNIEFPKQLMELRLEGCKFPVYAAYHKSAVGVFIASYEANKHTLDGLLFAEEKHLSLGLVSTDFNVNHQLLNTLYPMVDTRRFIHILSKETGELCEPHLERKAKSSDMISSRNGFKGLVAALVGAKKLLTALRVNRVIRILYAILSLSLIFFIALNGYSANTDLQILAYQSMWLLPVCAICTFCK